jgi:hypothetical protein
MEDEVPRLPDEPEPEEAPATMPLPSLPPEVADGDDELRQLIEAGASTPEELRDLAARIREHRDREDQLWRNEVRPALKKAKKGQFKLGDLVDRTEEREGPNGFLLAFGAAVCVGILVLAATQSTILWVLVPVVAVLIYAYRHGGRDEPAAAEPPGAEDAPD